MERQHGRLQREPAWLHLLVLLPTFEGHFFPGHSMEYSNTLAKVCSILFAQTCCGVTSAWLVAAAVLLKNVGQKGSVKMGFHVQIDRLGICTGKPPYRLFNEPGLSVDFREFCNFFLSNIENIGNLGTARPTLSS